MEREVFTKEQINEYDFQQLVSWEDIYIDDDYEDDDKLLYSVVESSIDDFDDCHGGIITRSTIFERMSDHKFFQMITRHSYDYFEIDSIEEVFPKEVTTIVYE